MCIGHQKLINVVILQRLDALDSSSAPVLTAEVVIAHPLDITQLRHRDDDIPAFDQILDAHVIRGEANLCSSFIPEFLGDLQQFSSDHTEQFLLIGQNRRQPLNQLHQGSIFFLDLASFQTCQRPQAHIHNRLCLNIIQTKPLHQFCLRKRDALTSADDPDHFIDVVERNQQAFQDMSPLLCLVQIIPRPSGDDILLVFQIILKDLDKVQHLRLAVHKRQHDDAECILQLRMHIQPVQDNIRIGILADIN